MPDEPSTIAWRLAQLEEAVRSLGQRVVSVDLYARDRAELERDIADLRAALAEERVARQVAVEAERTAREKADEDEEEDRKSAVQDVKTQLAAKGANWRQALYSGLIPGIIFMLGLLWQLRAGTGK